MTSNKLAYEGCRLSCNDCLYRPHSKIEEDKIIYNSCPMIDHKNIRLYTKIFGGYNASIMNCHICKYYKPAKWNLSGQKEWKGIEAYIEYMDIEYYYTPNFLEYNKLRDIQYVTLCTGGYDVYGEFQYHVSLYDWLTGDAVKNDCIKYRSKYKVIRTPKGKPKQLEKINGFGIDKIAKKINN